MTFTNRDERQKRERERNTHTKLDQGKAKMMTDTMWKPMTTPFPFLSPSPGHVSIGLLAGQVHLP